MPRILKRKKLVLIAAGAVVAAVAAFAAYAYFSSTGSGTGSASVGASSTIQLSSPAVGTLYPGGPAVPVTVSIHNPGSGNEFVGTISGTVADNTGCLGSWFTVDPITYDTSVVAGDTATASTNVRMVESNTNQDACQSKTVTINWSSN
jgi:hypothetical protein